MVNAKPLLRSAIMAEATQATAATLAYHPMKTYKVIWTIEKNMPAIQAQYLPDEVKAVSKIRALQSAIGTIASNGYLEPYIIGVAVKEGK